jgi:hypothetical protein
MGLTVSLSKVVVTDVFTKNITHAMAQMAEAAGLYAYLWHPEDKNISVARQLIQPLTDGLARLQDEPELFEKFNPPYGLGDFTSLVSFVKAYLAACQLDPDATVAVDR